MCYKTCPNCGAHLDCGERCDCEEKAVKITRALLEREERKEE
jgi:hypothetical protein